MTVGLSMLFKPRRKGKSTGLNEPLFSGLKQLEILCFVDFGYEEKMSGGSVISQFIPGKTNGRKITPRDLWISFDKFSEYHLGKALTQPPDAADLHCQREEEKSVVKKAKEKKRKANPMYRGLRQRRSGKWAAEIRDPIKGIRVWLGTYNSPEEAAIVYDREAREIRRKKAKFNFPEHIVTTDNSTSKVNVFLQSPSSTSESYGCCPHNNQEEFLIIPVLDHGKERDWLTPEVPEEAVHEYMKDLERVLKLNAQAASPQCFSLGVDFNNGVLQSHKSQVICSSSTERKKANELLCESSVCLDSIFEDVCDNKSQLESLKLFESKEGLFEWETDLYEHPSLGGKQNEFPQEACLRGLPFLKRENYAEEGWTENEESLWTDLY